MLETIWGVVKGAGELLALVAEGAAATPEEKFQQKNETAQAEKQWKPEPMRISDESREQERIANEKAVERQNQLVAQVFEDIKGELKARKSIKRTLRQFEWSDWRNPDRLYVELKDGVKAFIVADEVIGEVPEFPKVLSVSSSGEFHRFYMRYMNLPDISFIRHCWQQRTDDCYKVELLRYVEREHVGTEVRLTKFELHEGNGSEDSGENCITAELVDFKKWVVQTQKNLSRIVDLFNRHLQGEDLSSLLSSDDYTVEADNEAILPSRQMNGRADRMSAPKKGAKLDLAENSTTEFKTSIIFSPEENRPSSSQPLKIAQELAGFMNADGGDLYLGVDDSGYVVGIQNDLAHLQEAEICGQNKSTDRSFTYRPTLDGYSQKLRNIARFCLGEIAAKSLVDPEFIHDDKADVDYVRLHVKPSREKPVYCGKHKSFYIRSGTSVVLLEGEERDDYQDKRFNRKGIHET